MNSFPLETKIWKSCEAELIRFYGQAGRFYHNLNHVRDCLEQLGSVPHCDDRDSLKLALWFHDAIYDATRSDNETASAELAEEWISKMKLPPERIEHIIRLIQVTDHKTLPETEDEKLIIDIDLSILGRDKQAYLNYAKAIRQEYVYVPEEEYREGRKAVLEIFLNRETIYRTRQFREQFEERARDNIAGEKGAL